MKRFKYSSGSTPDLSDYLNKYVKSLINDVTDVFTTYIQENIVDYDEFSYEEIDDYATELYEQFIQDVELAEPSIEYLVVQDIPIDVAIKALGQKLYFNKKLIDEENYDED